MGMKKFSIKNFIPICGRSCASDSEDEGSEGTAKTRSVKSRGINSSANNRDVNSRGVNSRGVNSGGVNSRGVNSRDVNRNSRDEAIPLGDVANTVSKASETKNYQENASQNLNNAENSVKKNVEAEGNPGISIIESKRNIKASEQLDNILETVNDHIQQATINTQLACSTLRSLYTINASSVEEFINFRRRVTNFARIYSDEVFPLASKIINYIQDFMENYSTLEFNEFKEVVSSLAEDARQKQEMALSIKKLHVGIGDDLRNEEDHISDLLESLENEARIYKEKSKGLQRTSSNKALVDSIANEEESRLAISAAFHVKNFLSIPIKNFVVSLTSITEFFAFFGKELEGIADSSDDKQWDHYSRCREKANLIINSCRSYISAIPDCRADLAVIPDDYDENYVKEWLSTKGAQQLSLLG